MYFGEDLNWEREKLFNVVTTSMTKTRTFETFCRFLA